GDHPDFGRDTERAVGRGVRGLGARRALVGALELEPEMIRRLQEQQRIYGRVDVSLDVADVVARALLEDPPDQRVARRRSLEEQVRESLLPVADRVAVDLEDVAKRHPGVRAGWFQQQQVGP